MVKVLLLVKHHWILLTLLILAAITVLSLTPLKHLPPVPGTDKTHHLIAYTFLMFPVALRKPDKWLLLGMIFIAYSGAIELVQPYVNRYAEWLDLAANATGVVFGVMFAELMGHLFPERHSDSQ